MSSDQESGGAGAEVHIGLVEAIEALHAELAEARRRSLQAGIQFPIESMTVELKLGAVKTKEGKAAFRVPVVNAEIGGSAGWTAESTQTVTLVFGAPVDEKGNPLKVAQVSDHMKG